MTTHNVNYLFLWIHSAFAATSIAFFLALLSSTPETQSSTEILFSSFFFTVSLILNSSISFVLVWFKELDGVLESVFKHSKGWILIKIAIISFLLGLICFLFHYSFWFVLVAIFSGVISYFALGDAICSISENYQKAHCDNVE